jgi:hypothetical protein
MSQKLVSLRFSKFLRPNLSHNTGFWVFDLSWISFVKRLAAIVTDGKYFAIFFTLAVSQIFLRDRSD